MSRKKLVTRGRIELPFTAWEAVVLAAWPTGHFHTPFNRCPEKKWYTIGDSVRARRIMEGTMEGRAILNVLESQGYLHLEPLE